MTGLAAERAVFRATATAGPMRVGATVRGARSLSALAPLAERAIGCASAHASDSSGVCLDQSEELAALRVLRIRYESRRAAVDANHRQTNGSNRGRDVLRICAQSLAPCC